MLSAVAVILQMAIIPHVPEPEIGTHVPRHQIEHTLSRYSTHYLSLRACASDLRQFGFPPTVDEYIIIGTSLSLSLVSFSIAQIVFSGRPLHLDMNPLTLHNKRIE